MHDPADVGLETLLDLDGITDRQERIVPYEYESAAQLLEDFWAEVERVTRGGIP